MAHKIAMSGGGIALLGGLSASDLAAIGGAVIAGVGVAIQWYYKRKADRRDAELHVARLAEIREHVAAE
ncbi:MAG: hypothetical protein HOQ02_10365 [Lysobacter sp.]|nr:hypothetical protein [Lysobacter sp.]